MGTGHADRTVERLLRQQAALASFGTFAFRELDLHKILTEAARICALSLGVPFCKICRYRAEEADLLIEAGSGWKLGVIGRVVSQANESSPQGRAYVTGEPVIIRNVQEANNLSLPAFYQEHGIISTVDVLIPATGGAAYGVLEIDSPEMHQFDIHDINFLTGFANVLAEAVSTVTKNDALRALLEEKKLLAEELQHRVRNNLFVVGGMLDNFARATADESVRLGLAAIVRRVSTLAQVYDSLLGVGLSRTIELGGYLSALCASLPELQVAQEPHVQLLWQTDSVLLDLDSATTVGLVVAELVTNSYAHAFPEHGGTIVVALNTVANAKTAILTIQDNGIGLAPNTGNPGRGIGLVKRLMEQINGTCDASASGGTIWTLTFPIAMAATAFEPAA